MKQEFLLKKLSEEDNLNTIQKYIKKVTKTRGNESKSIQKALLQLNRKVETLSKNSRKRNFNTIENELADIFITLLLICNSLKINLYDSLIEKEKINIRQSWQENY